MVRIRNGIALLRELVEDRRWWTADIQVAGKRGLIGPYVTNACTCPEAAQRRILLTFLPEPAW